jgi:hypothetical protein
MNICLITIVSAAVLTLLTLLTPASRPVYADWKVYAKSEYLIFYYDTRVVRLHDNNTVRVWGKCYLNGEQGRQWLEGKSRIGIITSRETENICFSSYLIEVKCSNRTIREISHSYIDDRLTKLSAFDEFSSEWKFISPGSIGEKLHRRVCLSRK